MHEDAIAEIGTPATHNELIKLAIRNSDGIIVNGDNIPAEFIEYAQALGKAILPKQTPEEFPEACYAFYNTILGEQ